MPAAEIIQRRAFPGENFLTKAFLHLLNSVEAEIFHTASEFPGFLLPEILNLSQFLRRVSGQIGLIFRNEELPVPVIFVSFRQIFIYHYHKNENQNECNDT